MVDEIEVEGVGTIRPLNAWQISRLKQRRRKAHPQLNLAMAAGMSIAQWKNLAPDRREAVRWAWLQLTSPTNVPNYRTR